jgi:uncharacterized phiE125 gp8 family phage protein
MATNSKEPVSLDLAKAHCRIDTSDEDSLLEQVYIPAARQTVEQYTGLTLLTQPMHTTARAMPCGDCIALSATPASTITRIDALAPDGSSTPLDLDTYAPKIINGYGGSIVQTAIGLPTDAAAFRVAFVAGFPDGKVPPNLILAMLDFAGDAYENREAQQAGAVLQRNPRAVALMDPFRVTFGI